MEASSTEPDRICSDRALADTLPTRQDEEEAPLHVPEPLLVAIAVLLIGAIAACFVDRLGAPTLLLFLGLGMLLGEDGPGGITFDDATLVRDAGSVALALILLEGGVLANVPAIRRVIRPSVLLATLGVLITAGIASLAAHWALDVHWRTALLVGAVVSSTDAAAVFAAVRNVGLRDRVESVLELESGVNDPFAAILVIGLVEWQRHDNYGVVDAALLLVREAGLGLLGGALIGVVAVWLLRRLPLPSAGIAPVLVVGVALAGYASVTALGGSGLLTAYLIGLAVGDTRIPHAGVVRGFLQGGAWLAQIGLFVLLGLLVTPSRLPDEGLAPLVVAIALVLVARPLAVVVCTTPFRIPWREQAFLAWAGLRGGVPIVFATIPIAAGLASGVRVFDVVFYVVVVSVAAQGLTLRMAARRLGVVETRPVPRLADLDTATLQTLGAELIELRPADLAISDGTEIRSLFLPGAAIIIAIRRDDALVVPRGDSALRRDDHLYLLVERARLGELQTGLEIAAG
jgi:cell volume regulation protein A